VSIATAEYMTATCGLVLRGGRPAFVCVVKEDEQRIRLRREIPLRKIHDGRSFLAHGEQLRVVVGKADGPGRGPPRPPLLVSVAVGVRRCARVSIEVRAITRVGCPLSNPWLT
jgi:hypothetical protein